MVDARAQTSASMRISPQNPAVGEAFSVTINVKNGELTDFKAPNFENLKVISGPNKRTSMQIINGKSSSEISIEYNVIASSPGQYNVGPFQVSVNGKPIKIASQKIQVTKSNGANAAISSADVTGSAFIKLVTNKTSYYVGEQIVATLILYHDVDVSGYSLKTWPRLKGATLTELKRELSSEPRIQTVGSKKYAVHELKRISIMPNKAGELIIDPINAVVQKSESMGFFAPIESINVGTKALTLNIKNLPNPAKVGFTGAVGEYVVNVKYTDDKVEIGKGLDVILSIKGNGDANSVILPKVESNKSFEIFGPTQIDELSDETLQGIEHIKEVKYTIVPKKDTILNFKPSFVYFDVKTSSYKDAIEESVDLKFIKSSNVDNIKSAIADSKVKSEQFNWKGAFIGLLFGLMIFGSWMFLLKKQNIKPTISGDSVSSKTTEKDQVINKAEKERSTELKESAIDMTKYMPSKNNKPIGEKLVDHLTDHTPAAVTQPTQAVNLPEIDENVDYEKLLLSVASIKYKILNPNLGSIEILLKGKGGQDLELFTQLKSKIDGLKFGGLTIDRDEYMSLLKQLEG